MCPENQRTKNCKLPLRRKWKLPTSGQAEGVCFSPLERLYMYRSQWRQLGWTRYYLAIQCILWAFENCDFVVYPPRRDTIENERWHYSWLLWEKKQNLGLSWANQNLYSLCRLTWLSLNFSSFLHDGPLGSFQHLLSTRLTPPSACGSCWFS